MILSNTADPNLFATGDRNLQELQFVRSCTIMMASE